jgi:SagB-type dehydrogenase family enzyme
MSTIPLNLETDTVALPAPELNDAGLQAALQARRSTREFLPDPLPIAELSCLLWAAFGVNRSAGGRTAPSAHNWQEIEVYAVLAEGAYRYDARDHQLLLVSADDARAATGTQDYVAGAPVNLVYVADFGRMTGVPQEDRAFLAGADAGCIAQNVYLYCASAGLGTVVRGLIDRRRLAAALALQPTQRVVLAQTVGHAQPRAGEEA